MFDFEGVRRPPFLKGAQPDYILISSKWSNSLRNCIVYKSLNLGSDHRMVCANLSISLRASIKAQLKTAPID